MADGEGTNEAYASAGLKVIHDGIEHSVNSMIGIAFVSQGAVNGMFEPLIDFGEDCPHHLLFPIGEEVVKAALPETRSLANQGKACSFIAVFAEHFGQRIYCVGPFSDHPGHD